MFIAEIKIELFAAIFFLAIFFGERVFTVDTQHFAVRKLLQPVFLLLRNYFVIEITSLPETEIDILKFIFGCFRKFCVVFLAVKVIQFF